MCRDNVESPYYYYGGRGVYDMSVVVALAHVKPTHFANSPASRHPFDDPTPPTYFADYLNQASVQNALGVNLNYTDANDDVYFAFQATGDFIYDTFLEDIEMLLDQDVRVSLYYGDADYSTSDQHLYAVSIDSA